MSSEKEKEAKLKALKLTLDKLDKAYGKGTVMKIIKPYTKWIRSFSCTDGNEAIPRIAKEYGIKTLVGAWLGDDDEIIKGK